MPVIPAAIVVVFVGGFFLYKRADVRLVLILAAAAMFLVRATQPELSGARWNTFAQFFAEFAKGMIYAPAVIPICSAMGFAYVCKLTECDAHLVNLLCEPLRHVRWLLIPGGIAVAFFVNSAIVSQTSTVSVVGPVLIPLLFAAGISRQTAGAMLLLGGSMGGELLNPAAVEVAAIARATGVDSLAIIKHLLPYNLLACGTALLVFWGMALRYETKLRLDPLGPSDEGERCADTGAMAEAMASDRKSGLQQLDYEAKAGRPNVNIFKAMVPLVPILLLMFVRRWIPMPPAFITSDKNPIGEQTAIAAAMLIGVLFAAISAPNRIGKVAATFFDGAGFAYMHVISVITAATMFAESIKVNGLIEMMAREVQHAPTLVMAASVVVPWALATITGTAVGTAPLVISILLPVAMKTVNAGAATNHGMHVGGVNAIAAQYGRTSSPVAPVVIMCATLAQSRPLTLVKRVAIPLLAGGVVLFLAAIMNVF